MSEDIVPKICSVNKPAYEALIVRLKSGEYDGSDIMHAWIAVEDLIIARDRIVELEGRSNGH